MYKRQDDGEPFEEKMSRLTSELSELFAKSHELEAEIKERLGAIGYDLSLIHILKGTGNVSARPDYIILSLNIETLSKTYDIKKICTEWLKPTVHLLISDSNTIRITDRLKT